MLTKEQFRSLKIKGEYTLTDVAMLICTVDRLDDQITRQASELKQALTTVVDLQRRLDFYRRTSIKVLSNNG